MRRALVRKTASDLFELPKRSKSEFAGVGENLGAVALDVFVELDAGRATLEELEQPALTLGQWQSAQVEAGELKQVEGIQERHVIVLATMQALEVGHSRRNGEFQQQSGERLSDQQATPKEHVTTADSYGSCRSGDGM
jgi:hypothetical protein